MTEEMGHFGSMFGGFGALIGAPEGLGWGNYPWEMWMSKLYDQKFGYLWLHDISLTKRIIRTHFFLFLLITTNTIDGKPNCEVLLHGRNRKNDLILAQKLYFLNASSWPQEKDFSSVYCSL